MKGGYVEGEICCDWLIMVDVVVFFEVFCIEMCNIYGMGCFIFLVIVVELVKGVVLKDVVGMVYGWLYQVIFVVDDIDIGKGYGFVYYFYVFWL